jgi:hypothetical protein
LTWDCTSVQNCFKQIGDYTMIQLKHYKSYYWGLYFSSIEVPLQAYSLTNKSYTNKVIFKNKWLLVKTKKKNYLT